jgi:hypothetical protein
MKSETTALEPTLRTYDEGRDIQVLVTAAEQLICKICSIGKITRFVILFFYRLVSFFYKNRDLHVLY